MTTITAPNLTTFLEDLKSADLVGISLNPRNLGLCLEFTFGPETDDVAVELNDIIHLVISQPLSWEDKDICFWVGEVELRTLEEDAHKVLSSLSYPFQNCHGTIDVDSSSLIYFRLEGDIYLEVVCGNYQILMLD